MNARHFLQKCSLFGSAVIIHSFMKVTMVWSCIFPTSWTSFQTSHVYATHLLQCVRSRTSNRFRLQYFRKENILKALCHDSNFKRISYGWHACTHFQNSFNHVSIVSRLDKRLRNQIPTHSHTLTLTQRMVKMTMDWRSSPPPLLLSLAFSWQ